MENLMRGVRCYRYAGNVARFATVHPDKYYLILVGRRNRVFLSVGQQETRGKRQMRLSGKENSLLALVHPPFPWTRIIDLFAVDVCFRYGACSNGTRSPHIQTFYYSQQRYFERKKSLSYPIFPFLLLPPMSNLFDMA